jgi:hypothetical protein
MAVAAATETAASAGGAVKKSGGGRGLSFDEKRKRMNEYFLEKRDFFQLKDLEKHLPKATGIIPQSVKEVLQSLVDDRLVNGEKIGISNYFWSFPSQALAARTAVIEQLEGEIGRLREAREKFESQAAEAASVRQDTLERKTLLERLAELETKHKTLAARLELHRANDPKLLEAKRQAAQEAKTAANRWTDNIFTVQGYCANNFGINRSAFNEQFGLSDDFDYIE